MITNYPFFPNNYWPANYMPVYYWPGKGGSKIIASISIYSGEKITVTPDDNTVSATVDNHIVTIEVSNNGS